MISILQINLEQQPKIQFEKYYEKKGTFTNAKFAFRNLFKKDLWFFIKRSVFFFFYLCRKTPFEVFWIQVILSLVLLELEWNIWCGSLMAAEIWIIMEFSERVWIQDFFLCKTNEYYERKGKTDKGLYPDSCS